MSTGFVIDAIDHGYTFLLSDDYLDIGHPIEKIGSNKNTN